MEEDFHLLTPKKLKDIRDIERRKLINIIPKGD